MVSPPNRGCSKNRTLVRIILPFNLNPSKEKKEKCYLYEKSTRRLSKMGQLCGKG